MLGNQILLSLLLPLLIVVPKHRITNSNTINTDIKIDSSNLECTLKRPANTIVNI